MDIQGFSDLRLIGRGGFSTVYRAHQTAQSRDVAIKVLNVDVQDEVQRARFERECAATGRLGSHPNVMTVYESGITADGKPYIAMELCEGGSLADRIARSGPIPLDEALHVAIKIAGAVETAHVAGITHRDIKPENMLVTSFGEVVLADFGISALDQVRSGTATGGSFTLSHVPPEVLQGNTSEIAGDVYSLGSSLFRLISGRPPFADESTPIAVAVSKTMNDPVPELSGVPRSLNKTLAKAMAKTPTSRHATALDLAQALQEVQREAGFVVTNPVASQATPPGVEPTRPVTITRPAGVAAQLPSVEVASVASKSSSVKVASIVGLVALLLGGGGVFAFQQFGGDEATSVEVIETTVAGTTVPSTMAPDTTIGVVTTVVADTTIAPTTTVKKKKKVVATTAAPTTTVPPTTTTILVKPVVTIPILTIPVISISPNVLAALTCDSYARCAQGLFDAWKAGNRVMAGNYASANAVNIMFATSYAQANSGWAATVTKQTDYIYFVSSTRNVRPTKFTFFFNNIQTDFKVQSVIVN